MSAGVPRRTLMRVLALGALAAALGLRDRAYAHGGEDHGSPAPKGGELGGDVALLPIESQFLLGVRTERAKRGAIAPSVGLMGTVIAPPAGEVRIAAPFAGRVFPPERGFPRLGEDVKKGDVLCSIRPTIGGAEVAQLSLARTDATSRAAVAQTRLDVAERNVARLRSLEGVVAQKDLSAAEAELEIARAELARARADSGALSGNVGTQKLISTLDGTVVLSRPSAGEQVAEGTELFRIVDLSKLWVDARVPEADAARGLGERADISLVADPTVRVQGRRVAVAALVDPASRTVQALFEVDNAARRLRVGGLVEVAVSGAGAPVESVIVASSALVDRNGQPVVIVKTAPEAFEIRAVRLGARSGTSIGILAGLQPGERVVVQGAMTVLLAAGG